MTIDLPVAVDAMGGDEAPRLIVEGARLAADRDGMHVLLVGRPEEIGDLPSTSSGSLSIKAASEVIAMDAEPATSVRRMKDASIVRAAEAVRDGEAKALLSAGNTGAAMASSLLRMGRIKGVSRPAIAVPLPVFGGTPSTLLDCGANAECQPEWLVQFAQLGAEYNRARFGVETPRVGLLTIGEEAGKGNELVKAASALMAEIDWADRCGASYIGNVEGGDLLTGVADVVVADGFTGNVVLKAMEGIMAITRTEVRAAIGSTAEAAATRPIVDPLLDPVFDTLNAGKTGSAMLLGTKGVCLISHGSSSAETISHAIRTAGQIADDGVVDILRASIAASA